jgi:hypothetical protein
METLNLMSQYVQYMISIAFPTDMLLILLLRVWQRLAVLSWRLLGKEIFVYYNRTSFSYVAAICWRSRFWISFRRMTN